MADLASNDGKSEDELQISMPVVEEAKPQVIDISKWFLKRASEGLMNIGSGTILRNYGAYHILFLANNWYYPTSRRRRRTASEMLVIGYLVLWYYIHLKKNQKIFAWKFCCQTPSIIELLQRWSNYDSL